MQHKRKIGVIFGGRSAEHEVSLQSAKNIVDAMDKEKYDVVLMGIDKTGKWHVLDTTHYLQHADDPKRIALQETGKEVTLVPGQSGQPFQSMAASPSTVVTTVESLGELDAVFPVLHGPFGEDGTIQGMLRLADVPFVGVGLLGSAVSMDKDVCKRLLRDAGIPIARFRVCTRQTVKQMNYAEIREELGSPLFIKPANLGSSVGVSKVEDEAAFHRALEEALAFDNKVLIEEAIVGREIECSVLGNETPQASVPGEILPQNDFYSYEAKYIDENGAHLQIPAELDDETADRIRQLAIRVFQVLECEGMGRVDVFLQEDGQVVVNEINTIPGFTRISMYPKLWEASGLPYPQLIDRLIELAIERHERDSALRQTVGDD